MSSPHRKSNSAFARIALVAALALGAASCTETLDVPTGEDDPTFATSGQALSGQNGLLGMYYDNMDFTSLSMTRVDAAINFNWGNGAPTVGMGSDTFSVHWVAYLRVPTSGTYTFYTTSDDGSRLFIDGVQVVDNWGNHAAQTRQGDIDLIAGHPYRFEATYYENTGGASMVAEYAFGGSGRTAIPTEWFSMNGNGSGLHAQWFGTASDLAETVDVLHESLHPTATFGAGDPPTEVTVAEAWGARLSGYVEPRQSGQHTLRTTCNGPFYLWIDASPQNGVDPIVIDRLSSTDGDTVDTGITLTALTRIPMRLDFIDPVGSAPSCTVQWREPSDGASGPFSTIPTLQLHPARFGSGTGLRGDYYDNVDFTNWVQTRIDKRINFNWGTSAPTISGGAPMGSDTFSIEWRGELEPIYDELYTFHVTSDDGVRLWVNNELVINRWTNGYADSSGTIALEAGKRVPIRIQYYENNNTAQIQLGWSSESQFRQIVPQTQLYPLGNDATSGTGLEGHYYNAIDFSQFFATRNDPMVNFNWGTASPFPATSFNADNFSVRWLGQVRPRYSETYTFHTWSDDGVRLYVNNVLLIDNWTFHGATEDTAQIELIAGKRYDIRMDYFEGTGGAVARLLWSSPSQAEEPIPQSRLFPPPALGVGEGLLGEYYGVVDLNDRDLRLVRIDQRVNFSYTDTPPSDALPPSDHSIRWRGMVEAVYEEDYDFILRTSGGVRMSLEGVVVIDEWANPGTTVVEHSATLAMETGRQYQIEIEYSQPDVGGTIELYWESESQLRTLVPRRQLYPADPTTRVEFGECAAVLSIEEFDDGTGLPDGMTINGGLTLAGTAVATPDLWIANNNYTVTRIDTDLGQRIGTYPAGKDASRTAVDLNYNVWVANRAFGWWEETNGVDGIQQSGSNPDTYREEMGTVNKLIADCECPGVDALCVECVALTVNLGYNSLPRGLAVDADNNVWVGTWNTQRLYKIDNETGAILGDFHSPVRPYGLAIDFEGKIWIAQIDSRIGCFDTVTEQSCGRYRAPTGSENCTSPYGIAVDASMNVWFGNWTCNGLGRMDRASFNASVEANTDALTGAVVWNDVTPEFTFYNHPDANSTRGVAVDGDGKIWVASSSSHRLLHFDPVTETWLGSYAASGGPIGVGISDQGHAIAVSGWGGSNGRGQAHAYDSDGMLQWQTPTGPSSYSYSDMTGFQLRNFTAHQAIWNRIYDCTEVDADVGCVFDYLTWDATVPDGSMVQIRLRTGTPDDTSGETIWEPWSPRYAATPSPLGRDGYQGRYVEVEVTLTASARGAAPTLRAVQLWRCPQIYEPEGFDVDHRWIIDQDARNYGISWQLVDASWPETRWEFLDNSGHIRCILDSSTSITKGQHYVGTGAFPGCAEENHLSNVPVQRSVRTAYFNVDKVEWERSPETPPVTYYTLVNNPTEANGDMRIVDQSRDTVWVNWCRPENNWGAGLTGARVTRWQDGSSVEVELSSFPTDPTVYGTARGYAADATVCGTFADTDLTPGAVYHYRLEYQNGDAVVSQPLTLSVETYGRLCCDEHALGCVGVCVLAETGPTGCELPPTYETEEMTCDELDNDCDGDIDEGVLNACGFCGPPPVEVCDGIDNDCNGVVDDNPVDGTVYFWDGDGDGYGNSAITSMRCAPGDGWVAVGGDCDDGNAAINPGAEEICDGVDNNCNGVIDEGGAAVTWYRDTDGDGYGTDSGTVVACAAPPGYVAIGGDCDDHRSDVYPGAPELCDGVDNNCNGVVDEGFANVEFELIEFTTAAAIPSGSCDNAYSGEYCEGAMAVRFEVRNPSTFSIPTGVHVDFRMNNATGVRLTAPPIPLARAVAAGATEQFTYCFGVSHTGTHDVWVGLPNIGDYVPACGATAATESDVPFFGGEEMCDGLDNNCNGLVDDRACGPTMICAHDPRVSTEYRCVAAISREGEPCGDEGCLVSCEADSDCATDAECRNGTCVDMRFTAEEEAELAAEAAADSPSPPTPASAQEPSEPVGSGASGCSSVPGRRGTTAGWAVTLLALAWARRRRCRGDARD